VQIQSQSFPSPKESKNSKPKQTNYVEGELSSPQVKYDLYSLHDSSTDPYHVTVVLNDVPIQMELDTGAAVSVISEDTYKHVQRDSDVSYTGGNIQVLGTTKMKASYGKKGVSLSIYVVQLIALNLPGCKWHTVDTKTTSQGQVQSAVYIITIDIQLCGF